MESIGARLKNKRESKKLSFEAVYKKTNIHPDVLVALEEDRFGILSPIYIKGFLKTYSSFLGLDASQILDEYNALEVAKASVELKTKRTALDSLRPRINSRSIFIGILVVIFMFLSFRLMTRKSTKIKPIEPVATPDTSSLESKPLTPPKIKDQTPAKKIKTSPVRLGLRAKQNCWVRVKVDKRLVFQGTLVKGRTESWQAKEKIEVSIGNARAIELEANGKIISPLGRGREAIKNILITREGLTIGK